MPNFKYQSGIALPLIIIIAAVAGIISTLLFTQSTKNIQNIVPPTPAPTQTPQINTSTENPTESSKEAKVVPMDAPPDESVFQEVATPAPDTQPKEVDNRSEEQRQQDLTQRDQNRVREGIASNILEQNFTTFDFKKINFVLSTPKPSNNTFLSNIVGKLRILNFNSSPTPVPSPTTQPISATKYAMVVILDKILIHDDKDPVSNGEVQVVAGVKSADIEQHSATPFVNWYEANNDSKVKVHRPIFIAPWEKLGDKMAIWISVVDNDSLPEWANDLIKRSTDVFDGLHILYDSAQNATGLLPAIHPVNSFLGWLGGEEHIGTLTKVYLKSDNYGFGQGPFFKRFEERVGDATFYYSMYRLPVPPKPVKVEITLKKIAGGETGDWDLAGGDGDLYVWSLVSDGFAGGNELNSQTKRIPGSGTHDLSDHHDWNIDTTIFSHTTNSPVVFYEVGVWDKDDVNNDDELAVASGYSFPGLAFEDKPNTTTVTYGRNDPFEADEGLDANADVELEIKTTPVDSLF